MPEQLDQRRPNLGDYEDVCRKFSWERAAKALAGLPGGGLNIAFEATDRHVVEGRGDRIALRWIAQDKATREFRYRDLATGSARFCNALDKLGIDPGDRVFTLLGRVPALYIAALGVWKRGAVLSPLFSAFGPEPIKARMTIAEPKALVTTHRLFERKVKPILGELPFLKTVILVGGGEGGEDLDELLADAPDTCDIAATRPDDLAILHFTSGTTGRPKGAMHVHGAAVAHRATAEFALDLKADDVFWCTADPGWVTGTSYGIIAPLLIGCTMISDEEEFDAGRWYENLEREKVTVWYTAPTAIRMLMKAGSELPKRYDLSRLRLIASVGEPLNPQAVVWGREVLDRPIHDNWWQTETGGIMVSNYRSMPIRPGSMGRPVPGIEAGVVHREEDGSVTEIGTADEEGELALRPGWPSMFRGYLHEEERYRKTFAGGWYLSGDIVKRDADGYFWFVGRADDVIKSAGHLIGPFEVESVLIEHPAVAEAGVIGTPDPVVMEVVKAFVGLNRGFEPTEELRKEILAHARKRLGPAVAPREIDFRDSLPKTRSGKIMRRLLKARELGLPEGDISTLESEK
ncbi:acetate--CoA ligase [Lutibaculum baratangense]|uniref:acetate--CoA ligase n=1 Tax=Lutibaculum baratangense AMV1 TaxID=631454 RepID=V4RH66_9HYPH|nr:acetate--CoA ligase [Lutibaculum baratangense]ESR25461.1 Acetyl-coenzyme A synthetase [Lutibaculum baratangense AMV1]